MNRVQKIISNIIDVEGGYVDNPDDPGGATKYGITERRARLNGYTGDMLTLPRSVAERIYLTQYYLGPRFDQVAKLSPELAEELTDTGVNMGPPDAVRMLQTSLNAMNIKGTLYPDTKVDGYIGDHTLECLQGFLQHRGAKGVKVMLKALNCLQGAEYINLATKAERFETFVFGWLDHRVEI